MWVSGLEDGIYYYIAVAYNEVDQTLSNCIKIEVKHPTGTVSNGGGGGGGGGDSSDAGTIPFGDFYLIFTLLAVVSVIVYTKRKIIIKKI